MVLADCIGVSHSNEVDVTSAQHFVNSSLAPVLLFRRRLKSVADVLIGIRSRGFTQARWEALLRFLGCLHPWDGWVSPDLHGFYSWVFDSLFILNDITKQVVVSRRENWHS